ncbi:MAG: hypothetical protein ONB33_14410, partial [candidate division KSB1 bacterium]|nr:hypothetical protein [candidate division KSB1 bacterium]
VKNWTTFLGNILIDILSDASQCQGKPNRTTTAAIMVQGWLKIYKSDHIKIGGQRKETRLFSKQGINE